MLGRIGAAITAFGVMCADSECLLIPVVIVAVGIVVVMIGERRSANGNDNQCKEK